MYPDLRGCRSIEFPPRLNIPDVRNFPDGRYYGVLAQAVEKVVPDIVATDKNGAKAVNYSGLIPFLIEAIKEQQKLIVAQQKQLDDIQQSLNKRN